MNFFRSAFAGCAAAVTASLLLASSVRADDGIFRAAPAARPFIDFDGRGFLLGGRRTFLTSGSLHYSRVPRALWRDRLLKFKRAGFNTVQTYVFWNIHEPRPGQFNFSGDADLGAFLSLAQSLGMYAVVRVGPYYCAEWDSGGYPVWLRNVPGLRVREDNEPFKREVGTFFDKLLPIVKAHEIHRGGNVIMVQLENEHPQGWGREMPNGYFRFLRDKYLAAGLEVPYFFSGLHHGSDPAGNRSWDSENRDNPWYSTEFWPGWFDLYGPLSAERLRFFDRGTWKILAYGGNGYNYYMLHGGTNFGYTNSNEDTASYDYAAAVGQAGDLRPIYTRFKRAAVFATSFASILENSRNADQAYQKLVSESGIKVTARQSPSGTLVFLDNPGTQAVQTQIQSKNSLSAPVTIEAGEIMPVVENVVLAPGITLDWSPTRVLGISTQNHQTTLVVYGPIGSPVQLHFSGAAQITDTATDTVAHWTRTGQALTFRATFSEKPVEANLAAGNEKLRVVALPTALADRTWFVDADAQKAVIVGPEYVGDVTRRGKQWQIATERPWDRQETYPTYVYSDDAQTLPARTLPAIKRRVVLGLSSWQRAEAGQPSQTRFDDSKWLTGEQPLQMGSDNDASCYAWYRTAFHADTAGQYTFSNGQGGDNISLWLDGRPATQMTTETTPRAPLELPVSVGDHTLALFVSHNGRDKLFNYLGPINSVNVKGVGHDAALFQTLAPPQALTEWKVRKLAVAPSAEAELPADTDANGWSDYQIGTDAFDRKPGWAWFATTLPPLPANATPGEKQLRFASVDEDATVYLNGQKLGAHQGWNQAFTLTASAAWKSNEPNRLLVLIHNQDNTGGIDKPVTLAATRSVRFGAWKLRGGPSENGSAPAYSGIPASAAPTGPKWYRATFDAPKSERGVTIWRVKPRGLSRGSVWLNGHNLGRYPEKIPIDGLYLPECWLKNGANTLEIFDEEGRVPSQVSIEAEPDASRDTETLVVG